MFVSNKGACTTLLIQDSKIQLWETQISKSLTEILNCICVKSTQVKHFLFHLCRPWMAFSSWLTWRATSCLCLRMWPSTCITTRRSSWTPVSTACCMLEIMLSSSRTFYQSPSVSQRLISHPTIILLFGFFVIFSFSVSLSLFSSMLHPPHASDHILPLLLS